MDLLEAREGFSIFETRALRWGGNGLEAGGKGVFHVCLVMLSYVMDGLVGFWCGCMVGFRVVMSIRLNKMWISSASSAFVHTYSTYHRFRETQLRIM